MELFQEFSGAIDSVVSMIACDGYASFHTDSFKAELGRNRFVAGKSHLVFHVYVSRGSVAKYGAALVRLCRPSSILVFHWLAGNIRLVLVAKNNLSRLEYILLQLSRFLVFDCFCWIQCFVLLTKVAGSTLWCIASCLSHELSLYSKVPLFVQPLCEPESGMSQLEVPLQE